MIWIILVLELIVILIVALFVFVLVRFVPPRVVEITTEPPPNAHYTLLDTDTDTLEPETEAAINAQKVAEIFYHALAFADGYCSVRMLYRIINQHWNSHYDAYPEYKKHWKITKGFIEETVAGWDYTTSGRIVMLVDATAKEALPSGYLLLPCELNGNQTRRLKAVQSLVDGFLGDTQALKKSEPEETTAETEETEAQSVLDSFEGVLELSDGYLGDSFEDVLWDDEPVPVEAKRNGHYTAVG